MAAEKPHPIAPGMACIITGFTNEWHKKDNGRIVIVLRAYKNEQLGDCWIIRPRPGEGSLHVAGLDGTQKVTLGAAITSRNLLPICPAREIHVVGSEKREG